MTDPIFGKPVARALDELPPNLDPLAVATRLRQTLPAGVAARAAELHALRIRAQPDHGPSRLQFLTRKGLEQATPARVAEARGARLARVLGAGVIAWDAACGLGSDALGLLDAGLRVVATDRDAQTASFARANLWARAGAKGRFAVAQAAAEAAAVKGADVLLLDPDRRAGRGRGLDPGRWSPSLAKSLDLCARHPAAALRIAPGFDPGALHPLLAGRGLRARLQWVSCRREAIELNVFLGALAAPDPALGAGERELLSFDAEGRAARLAGNPGEPATLDPGAARSSAWLADPDPCVSPAGLLGVVAAHANMARLGPGVAFLGGREQPDSPFLRAWRVLGSAPVDRRRIRALLAEHDIGPLTVKTRRSPESAEDLARRLRGSGSRRGLLAVAPTAEGPWAWLLH